VRFAVAAVPAALLLLGVYLIGLTVGQSRSWSAALRDRGLHRETADLYSRAVRLIHRLDATTDLDGAMAGDVLSPETKKQVAQWMADHRKGLARNP
jgi:hypothetical protein